MSKMIYINDLIRLRYIQESDIDDYIRWTTTEIEWADWDAPWETDEDDSLFLECQRELLNKDPHFYSKLEIHTVDGNHIGWVSCYDTKFDGKNVCAVGIGIPSPIERNKGYGKAALSAYMAHLFDKEETLYTQTWSGNTPMVRLAEKLGFSETERKRYYREVRGRKYDALTFCITKVAFFKKFPNLSHS